MGYKVIYLDGEERRPKKDCKICKALERNVIEPVAVFLPEGKNLSDLPEEELEKFDTCIFHCDKENEIWMKNLEEWREWKKRRDEANAKGEGFNEPFEIKWEENLVRSFWDRLRAYCFVIENSSPFNENTYEIIQMLKKHNLSQEEFQKAKQLIEFYSRTYIDYEINEKGEPEYFHDFKGFIFPQFTSPLIGYINTPNERKSKVAFSDKSETFVTKESLNFWYKNTFFSLKKEAHFINSTFLDHVYLDGTHLEKCNFTGCNFQRKLNLRKARISELEFALSNIEEDADITETSIKHGSFISNVFNKKWELKLRFNELLLQDNKVSEDLIFKAFKDREPNLKNLVIKKISLQPDSLLILEGLTKTNLTLNSILNENFNLFIRNCSWNERNLKVEITNSILKRTFLLNCEFLKGKIEIENSDLTDIRIANVNWGDISEDRICPKLFKNEPEKARDIYRQLKLAHDNQKDYITANAFYALEMKAHERELYKEICKNKGKIPIFTIHKAISNFGQSWFRPLVLLLLLTIGYSGYSYIKYFDKYQNEIPDFIKNIFLPLSLAFTWEHIWVVILSLALLPAFIGLLSYPFYKRNYLFYEYKNEQSFFKWFKMNILPKLAAGLVWLCFIFIGIIGIKGLIGLFYQLTNQCGLNYQESISFILDETARKLNIFNRLGKGHSTSAFIETLYFITTSFLIYQIIVAVRRQVRR